MTYKVTINFNLFNTCNLDCTNLVETIIFFNTLKLYASLHFQLNLFEGLGRNDYSFLFLYVVT